MLQLGLAESELARLRTMIELRIEDEKEQKMITTKEFKQISVAIKKMMEVEFVTAGDILELLETYVDNSSEKEQKN